MASPDYPAVQAGRFGRSKINVNARMSSRQIKKHCELTPGAERLLGSQMESENLSARAYTRVLKVARTIADLAAVAPSVTKGRRRKPFSTGRLIGICGRDRMAEIRPRRRHNDERRHNALSRSKMRRLSVTGTLLLGHTASCQCSSSGVPCGRACGRGSGNEWWECAATSRIRRVGTLTKRTQKPDVSCGNRKRPCLRRPSDLEAIVAHYIQHRREGAQGFLQHFANQRTLDAAVEKAAMAWWPDGKRHPHQRRIPCAVLTRAKELLLRADLSVASSFEELHAVVVETIGGVNGVGELMVYDTAHRIGAFLGLEPRLVFLHSGTRAGAKALGLDHRAGTLDMKELPSAFRRLRPHEVEDCLCIYKAEFQQGSNRRRHT